MNIFKKFFGPSIAEQRADRLIFGTMLAFGLLGLIASFALSVERFIQLTTPGAQLICDFNAIFSCGVVMQTWQASLFGFPNSFIGLMAYPVVITLAVAGLCGVRFPRAFMAAAQVGFGLGLIFAYWLFFQSVFVIHVLCPWCLIVTVSTTVLFEALLAFNLRKNNLYLPKNVHARAVEWLKKDYDKLITVAWLVAMFVLVLLAFPDIF